MPSNTLCPSAPSTAHTAPVHEHRCLYTHDLRRKQKRWQDGFLKFHTFNRRVMVYDQPRNYIGDTHWKDSDTLADGDELTLENGVIVQVAEQVATTETDLTSILQKKPREVAEMTGTRNARLPTPGARGGGLLASAQPRHKPLSQLLGTPKGAHGRAMLPLRSPFEERQGNQENEFAMQRAVKRQRVAEAGQAWNSVKAAKTPRPNGRTYDPGTSDVRERMVQATTLSARSPARTVPEVINLSSDHDDWESELEPRSDLTLPNTPPIFSRLREPKRLPPKAPETPKQPPDRFSPPVSTTNRVMHVQEETELLEEAIEESKQQSRDDELPPVRSKKLRLVSAPRRKKLLCEDTQPPTNRAKPTRLEHRSSDSSISESNVREMTLAHGRMDRRVMNTTAVTKENSKPSRSAAAAQPAPPIPAPAISSRKPRRVRPGTGESSEKEPTTGDAPPPPPAVAIRNETAKIAKVLRGALQRPASLNISVAAKQMDGREPTPPSPVLDLDVGPWSTEAADLFDWMPPGYVFRGQGKGFGVPEPDSEKDGAAK